MADSGISKIREFIDPYDIKNNYYTKKEINSILDKCCPKILTPIGGKIFYDAGANGATYTFYNSSGNVISDTSISGLQSAKYYTVVGTPTKDRFYVVYPSILNNGNGVYWGFYRNVDIKSSGGNIVNTGTAIGTGKTATRAILDYISIYASSETTSSNKPSSDISQSSPNGYNLYKNCGTTYNYLWDIIGDANNNSLGGCKDWFVPSKDEMKQIGTSGVISDIIISNYIWVSSTYYSSIHAWYCSSGGMSFSTRDECYRCVVCRAF